MRVCVRVLNAKLDLCVALQQYLASVSCGCRRGSHEAVTFLGVIPRAVPVFTAQYISNIKESANLHGFAVGYEG
jgi:hypothetical protein